MPNWIGDVVMATPFLKGLRHHFPEAHITLFMRPYLRSVLEGAPWFDEIVPMRDKGILGPFQLGRKIRKMDFDGVFLLLHSWRGILTFWMARVPERIGYGFGGKGFFLTHTAAVKAEEWEGHLRPIPMDLYYLRILEAYGKPYGDRKLELPLSEESELYAEKYFNTLGIEEDDLVIGLNPGAAYGASKLWPPEHFARLGDLLVEKHNARVLILCGPGEEGIAASIQEKMEQRCYSTHEKIIPLHRLGAVVKRCSLMVSTDSGPRHFATAFDVPLLVLVGPIHPGYTILDQDSLVMVQEKVECAPCHKKLCPIDHRCMVRLTPEKVLREVDDLLKKWVF